MVKFLRISSIYPEFIKIVGKKINQNNSYEKILSDVFDAKYSVSNYISKELSKKGYVCNEIIHNFKILQKKWLHQYGDIKINDKVIYQQIKYYNPDILYVGDINLLNKEFREKVKSISDVKLILCFHCAPFQKKIFDNLFFADSIITCTEGYREKITKILKKDTLLMQHAFNNISEINFNEKRDIDISFLGSLFLNNKLHVGRIEIIYKLIRNYKKNYIAINFAKYFLLDFFIFIFDSIIKFNFLKNIKTFYKIIYIFLFSKKPVFGKDMLDILKKTKIVINKHIEDTKYAGNMRLFEGTGSGCLLITDYKKDLEKLFHIDSEITAYNDDSQIIEKINFYLQNEKKRLKIAENGYKKTTAIHNYRNRINVLDKFLKKKLINENI